MRNLPPLNALRVFEVAARTGSYATAAAELGLTHGAVSRHIGSLEAWFGHKLFQREGRRMVATPRAAAFASEVGRAFDRVSYAADAFGGPAMRRILRVSAPTSFAMRWLIPRLDRFHTANQEIEVVIATVSTVLDDVRGGFDVAIRRGAAREGAWPHHRAVPVLDDVDTLIASPALLKHRPITRASDIEGHMLLGSETRPGDWIDWLDAAGLSRLSNQPRRTFDHFFVTRQAVVDGLGIGIGPMPMLDIDVASGRLVTPLPDVRVRRGGYVALVPGHVGRVSAITTFVDWLEAEGTILTEQSPAI
ncbi:LysR substrate-binding domain-containing protein [Sphingobium baderi]|uniref:LysR family transcriptional regulator n=1 Tax=Sphingobium baderi TaxID=1332080 RepID=A0A0S3F609_9SPHN|nr:LysR substrate-binding domain-containing protein [Sphingobium baderi]ALR23099.1 LysR family transcriptional regulator [Sphingobium baderi]